MKRLLEEAMAKLEEALAKAKTDQEYYEITRAMTPLRWAIEKQEGKE